MIPWNLIITYLKGEATIEEEMLFQDWISKRDNNDLFVEIKHLWEEVRSEASQCNPDVDHYWAIMKERMHKEEKKRVSISKNIRAVAAVAGILLIMGVSFFFMNKKSNEKHTYSAINGKSKIILPDSSTVWLNSGTTVSYPGAFAANRYIDLTGEAAFDVVKDDKHPFIVSTYGIDVKVHGTYFNISSYDNQDNITVALKEGSVSILMKDSESFLKPGEMAVINKKDLSVNIEKADMSLEFFWANESVYFKAKSLGYICQYLEKWYNIEIEVDPDIARSQFYTFTIKDDSLDQILRIMSKINPITYSFEENDKVKIMKVKP